jgi:hypothetical protein
LAALFPDRRIDELVSDLMHVGLDEIAAAMPYVAGPKIISRDDHGDPSYEDVGLTPRFVELTRRFKKELQAALPAAPADAPAAAPVATPMVNPVKGPCRPDFSYAKSLISMLVGGGALPFEEWALAASVKI